MKVANARSTGVPGRSSVGSNSDVAGNGFARTLEGVSGPRLQPAVGASGCSAVAGVLALQEVQGATEREARRKAVRRGERLLDELDHLRLAILSGAVDTERMIALAQMVRARCDHVDDPGLSEIVAEIELRVEVELAKRRR